MLDDDGSSSKILYEYENECFTCFDLVFERVPAINKQLVEGQRVIRDRQVDYRPQLFRLARRSFIKLLVCFFVRLHIFDYLKTCRITFHRNQVEIAKEGEGGRAFQ